MTRVVQFMRDLVAKGMSWEDAAMFAERFEDGLDMGATASAVSPALEKKRARDRDRYWRGKGETGADSASETVSEIAAKPSAEDGGQDARAPTYTRGEDNLSRLDTTGGFVVGVVGAREPDQPTDDWPKGDHVKLLIQAIDSPWLDPSKSQNLITTAGRVAAWKRDGASWEHDVLPVVRGLCANRRSRVDGWKFFDAAIGRSIADNRAALEIPEAGRRLPGHDPPRRQTLAEQIGAESAAARSIALKALANG